MHLQRLDHAYKLPFCPCLASHDVPLLALAAFQFQYLRCQCLSPLRYFSEMLRPVLAANNLDSILPSAVHPIPSLQSSFFILKL